MLIRLTAISLLLLTGTLLSGCGKQNRYMLAKDKDGIVYRTDRATGETVMFKDGKFREVNREKAKSLPPITKFDDTDPATAALRLTGEGTRHVPEQEAVAETQSDEAEAEQERLAKAAKEKEDEQFLLMQLQLQQQQQAQFNAMMMQMINTPMPNWTPTPSPEMPSRRSFQSQGYCALHQCHYTMGIGMGGGCPKCNTASYGLDARARCPRCGQEFDFTFGHTCLR